VKRPLIASAAVAVVALAGGGAAAENNGVDLALLGLDPNAEAFDDRLNIYGFADLTWWTQRADTDLVAPRREFILGNINFYVAKNLTPRWRALTEVRFMLAPNGGKNLDGTYNVTTSPDPANFDRSVDWGGISIERAYLEYDLHPRLGVRAGRWLTPYGIWNIDHGSPTVIGTMRPYIIGEQLFPERQTGLELFGSLPFGEYRLAYHATLSNGRNPFEASRDPDQRPGLGGRIALEAPIAGPLRVGASAYRGRFTDATGAVSYDELALGADLQWNRDGIHAQGELLARRRGYFERQRDRNSVGFLPDSTAWGYYGLAGYRFQRLWNVMPYGLFEEYHLGDSRLVPWERSLTVGLNFRPTATVVLKTGLSKVWFDQNGALENAHVDGLRLQASWVF
jgi:hypothetical protein